MTKNILTFLLAVSLWTTAAQSFDDFKKEFEEALKNEFSEEALENMLGTYSSLLTPHSGITQLTAILEGQKLGYYPLQDFKSDQLYTSGINKLLFSENSNHRILAYLVISAAGDITYESTLLTKLKEEQDEHCAFWAGMALLYLKTVHTTPLFDYIVEYEKLGDSHMLHLYITLNQDSLQQTAYMRINSENPKAQIIAAQLLSVIPLNSKTEELLKKAVREWDYNIKGYAIYSVAQLQMGNLLEAFKPLLDSTQTRGIALIALANSPTEADRRFLYDLAEKQDTVSEELLDCFYKSKSIDNMKFWLKLLYSKSIPKEYIFIVNDRESIIKEDTLLSDVHTALLKITNADVLKSLVQALEGRTDEKSTGILLGFLTHKNSSLRYWAANSLKGNRSPVLIAKLPELLKTASTRVTSLTDLAIENNLDNLQAIHEDIYKTETSLDWQRTCIEYLSTFPKAEYSVIFKKILQDKDEDFFMKINAANGLGKLKDESAVDLIISVCRENSKGSDHNAQYFLEALGMIKGDKAKAEIERFKNSKNERVRTKVEGMLKDW